MCFVSAPPVKVFPSTRPVDARNHSSRIGLHDWDIYKCQCIITGQKPLIEVNVLPRDNMTRFALVATALVASLLSLFSGVNAMCYACPNCDYDNISTTQGNACLNYWTCSGSTIICYCYYPSVENPGTFSPCEFTGTTTQYGYYDFALTSGPSVCDGLEIGDNPKCEPSNDPWNAVSNVCTASEAYVGEPNSGLL
ncbi:hypothetical protein BS17DRAFT_777470 [Gyrodon lividus]|nr:hypothetical protein BS17DRAFT_777470 [Gyrodon lividus]